MSFRLRSDPFRSQITRDEHENNIDKQCSTHGLLNLNIRLNMMVLDDPFSGNPMSKRAYLC